MAANGLGYALRMPAKRRLSNGDRKRDPAVGAKIRMLRTQLGETQAVFGERFGVEQATVSRWEKGWLPERKLEEPIAELAGMTVAEFFHSAEGPRLIPIVGKLTTGESFALADRPTSGRTIEHIMLSLGETDQVAVTVEGDSIYGRGAVIIAKRLPRNRTPEAIGRNCVVASRGTGYVGVLKKGSKRGLYTVRSYNPSGEDLEDVDVEWVAPIAWVRFAQ